MKPGIGFFFALAVGAALGIMGGRIVVARVPPKRILVPRNASSSDAYESLVVIVTDAGHAANSPGITEELIRATDRFASSLGYVAT
jgi:hypothetical protein